jgi:hypothetical protein
VEGRSRSTPHFHCWLIFIVYIACENHSWFFVLPLIVVLSKCFEQLGYVVSVFNHWIFLFCIGREANMWVCRLGSNVSGLCRSKLGCSWQDSLRIGVLTPSVLWVYVIFLIFVAFESSVVTSSEACTALDPQAILTNPP